MNEGTEESSGLTLRERIAYRALRGLAVVLRLVSVRRAASFGASLGLAGFRCMAARRRIAINNLRIVFGGKKTFGECETVAREVFRRSGANLVGGFRAGLLPEARLREVVELRGLEHAREASRAGKGVIILIGHMGPWEVLAQVGNLIFPDMATGALYRPIDNRGVDRFVREQRQKIGTRLFSRKEGFGAPVALLRAGGALGILADQRAGKAGVRAPFFGRPALTTRLPYILHRKTGAPLMTLSVSTRANGRWVVQVHQPFFPGPEDVATKEVFVRRCNAMLEGALRDSLEDVFWFHQRWRPEKRAFFPGDVGRRAFVVLPDDREAAVACAWGIKTFRERRPAARFILAGPFAAEAARAAGLPDGAEDAVTVPASAGRREMAASVDFADRLGQSGIDGALVFAEEKAAEWAEALRIVGSKAVLGFYGEPRNRGVSPAFHGPEAPTEPSAYRKIFESLETS